MTHPCSPRNQTPALSVHRAPLACSLGPRVTAHALREAALPGLAPTVTALRPEAGALDDLFPQSPPPTEKQTLPPGFPVAMSLGAAPSLPELAWEVRSAGGRGPPMPQLRGLRGTSGGAAQCPEPGQQSPLPAAVSLPRAREQTQVQEDRGEVSGASDLAARRRVRPCGAQQARSCPRARLGSQWEGQCPK